MLHRLAADATLLLHLVFIAFAFAVGGSVLALRWRWVPWAQLPAAAWAVWIEWSGRLCPLTGIENRLRQRAGDDGYAESFVERYLLGVVYPEGLTRDLQLVLALVVVGVNAALYAFVVRRRRAAARSAADVAAAT